MRLVPSLLEEDIYTTLWRFCQTSMAKYSRVLYLQRKVLTVLTAKKSTKTADPHPHADHSYCINCIRFQQSVNTGLKRLFCHGINSLKCKWTYINDLTRQTKWSKVIVKFDVLFMFMKSATEVFGELRNMVMQENR